MSKLALLLSLGIGALVASGCHDRAPPAATAAPASSTTEPGSSSATSAESRAGADTQAASAAAAAPECKDPELRPSCNPDAAAAAATPKP